MEKNVLAVLASPQGHWVGDGFPVRSLFSYESLGGRASPFLLLDYAGPAHFEPSPRPRGVGEHPHRGFETVTIVYAGQVAHRDSAGNGGVIGPGDVQWMTAASGILHEEFHSPEFTRHGGMLEMAQLWVNLPAKDKMSPPRYQTIPSAKIPEALLPGGAGRVRVIGGRYGGSTGPADTFTELNVWDVRIDGGTAATMRVPEGHNALVAVLRGTVAINGARKAGPAELVVLDRAGEHLRIESAAGPDAGAVLLVLSGAPIDEPIVGHGPFVMNTRDEIDAAMRDFRSGGFGRMARDARPRPQGAPAA